MSGEHKPKKVYTLLFVDDDAVVIEDISNFLAQSGYKIFTSFSAEEALEVLSKHHIDLVITGVVMPGMNGLELTKIIKKNYDSDVIIFTGSKPNRSYKTAISLGASDILYKPFKFEDLLDSVRRILGTSNYRKYSQMNHHILCVDDHKPIGEMLVESFRRFTNCTIAHVMNANEAFEYLENNRVDLVITNQRMPGMGGLEMTNVITKRYPTKVIVLTGGDLGGERKEAFHKGAKAFVLKPCGIDDLLEIVYKVMTEGVSYIGMGMQRE
jgi:DNA-binding NtrC family response regulator